MTSGKLEAITIKVRLSFTEIFQDKYIICFFKIYTCLCHHQVLESREINEIQVSCFICTTRKRSSTHVKSYLNLEVVEAVQLPLSQINFLQSLLMKKRTTTTTKRCGKSTRGPNRVVWPLVQMLKITAYCLVLDVSLCTPFLILVSLHMKP